MVLFLENSLTCDACFVPFIIAAFKHSSGCDSDIKLWNTNTDGKPVTCAKIRNAITLIRPATEVWTRLAGVRRLEIEDPEGILQTVPKQLCFELPNLESLSVKWSNIRTLPPRIYQLPLTTLYLQRNQLKSLDGLEQVTRLTVLDVSHNMLEVLPDIFVHLTSLEVLNIADNRIAHVPDSIGSACRLVEFNCSHNRLSSLPNSVGNITQLTILDVGNNQLTCLPASVGNLVNLRDLRARNNLLRSLPDSFSQLQHLTSLLLRNNKFRHVPSQLSTLANLENLNMSDNEIAHMAAPIQTLKYLVLDQNDFAQIDPGIVQCSNLQLLSLKRNRLGQMRLTEDIGQLTNIQSLFLSYNAISCVPVEVGRLKRLLHLSLSSTNIQTIPLAVASLSSLQTLELEDCTELDHQLTHAYKTRGRAGVVDYLKQQPNTETRGATNVETSNDVDLRPNSKPRVKITAKESIFPVEPQTVASSSHNSLSAHAEYTPAVNNCADC